MTFMAGFFMGAICITAYVAFLAWTQRWPP